MARWDEILSLPVQNPPTSEFSSADLVWSKVEGWHDTVDRLSLIPYARVEDFVKGESNNKECPTKFHREASRKRAPSVSYKSKVDGVLEYIMYWCSYGPDDHRVGGHVRPSRNTYVPKNKTGGRPNTKRGCVCHFIVKRLIAEPTVALIIYNHDKHVDKSGLPCHGPQDDKAAGTRAMYAPTISEELRLRVLSLLHVGVSVETIMQRHNEAVEKQGGPSNMDDLMKHRYVRRLERNIRRSTYELDEDDAVSISMWVEENYKTNVFFYQDFSNSDPLTLGIQTEWQLQQMIRFGNSRLLVCDSRFGSNKLKYPVCSLVVFNSENKAIPVAWIISTRFASRDTYRWMRALHNRVIAKDPTWKLAGFIVDEPSADFEAIREIFQCSVLICFWRVRHAWHKNLMKRCSDMETRAEMLKKLGQAVKKICKGTDTANAFNGFMEDSVEAEEFMDYFRATWYPRIGSWAHSLKTLPLASQETCAAMEFYHKQLKLRLLNEKDQSVYQRADWLVNKLATTVHSFFWLDEYSGKEDFARYRKDEWVSDPTAWRKSMSIPDANVVIDGKCAKVIGLNDQNTAHLVWNPGSEYAICDCSWAKMGNLCEHIFKMIKFCRDNGSSTPSTSMFHYSQALIKLLHCPRFDSLVCDHAASLSIWVQKQLNMQTGPESNQDKGNTTEQQSEEPSRSGLDKSLDNENQCPDQAENLALVKRRRTDCEAGDVGGSHLESSVADIEIASSPISTSAPQSFPSKGNASVSQSVENGADMRDAGLDRRANNLSSSKPKPKPKPKPKNTKRSAARK